MPEKIIQTGKRYATVDVGSNSILLYIAKKNVSGHFTGILDKSEITRLGKGLYRTAILSNDSIQKSISVLKNYKKICDAYNVIEINAVGTMALRMAKNSDEFIEQVKKETGIKIEIISGEEEARLSYIAVKTGFGIKEKTLIFDTGGGSIEFIYCNDAGVTKKFSVNIGAVRLTEQFLKSDPVKPEEIVNAENVINEEISASNPDAEIKSLIGTGGTVTNLTAIKQKMAEYNPALIQGSIISVNELTNLIAQFSSKTIEERKKIAGLEPKRADVILAGALIIKCIMKNTGQKYFIVSDYGIRHGLMFDRF
ncbi:MAG: Ppx/GppA family phosphatase [Ignavibacteria bacterium]|nr:Ppx/GppA family phosphatase [Ignavibacteria bacterium]